jgi:DNA-binding transcriptional LysR family regulator
MHPGVSFGLSFMNQPWAASEKVLSGEVDFAFIDLVDVVQSQVPVISNHLIIERQIVVGDKSLLGPWKNRRMPYEEIVKFPFVAYIPKGRAEKLWCKRIYGRIPPELDIVFDCQNLRAMINGVKQGLGLGLIPAYLVEKELKSGRLIKVRAPGPDYENNIGLVRAPDRKPSLAERRFVDFTFSELKKRGKYL